MMPILYLILFLAVFGSGFTVSLFTIPAKAMKLMLAFTGSLLFSIAVLDLIPEVYSSLGKQVEYIVVVINHEWFAHIVNVKLKMAALVLLGYCYTLFR